LSEHLSPCITVKKTHEIIEVKEIKRGKFFSSTTAAIYQRLGRFSDFEKSDEFIGKILAVDVVTGYITTFSPSSMVNPINVEISVEPVLIEKKYKNL